MTGRLPTVNFATEKARVSFPGSVAPQDLVRVVEQAGYTAALPAPPPAAVTGRPREAAAPAAEPEEAAALRRRLLISAALTVPVVILAFIPVLQFRYYQWLSLALATPV